jgi:hypothetical protein
VEDAELSAGDRVRDREVGAAVVGEDPLDGDAVAAVERERAAEEADSGGCFLVCEDLGVGEAAVVVDGDVDVLPAGRPAQLTLVAASLAGRSPLIRCPTPAIRASFFTSTWTSSPGRDRS